jgi:putative transposase
MAYKLFVAAERSWHRIDGHDQLLKLGLGVRFRDGVEVARSQARAAIA